jgi:nitroimidazol reductase NimA-like FMN-containing flavoprotein (pyridoxamine 5'-phosphate oxidase superfamily)
MATLHAVKMMITELTEGESIELLSRAHLGRLACTQDLQPYVTPFYFVYDNHCLYSFSTIGQKVQWMRVNPLVSVQTDEIVSEEQWESVVASGRYEELPDTPDWAVERATASALFQRKAVWWEPGIAKTTLKSGERPMLPVVFRIHLTRITGHRGER